jgi:anti-sigma B factor antagonist
MYGRSMTPIVRRLRRRRAAPIAADRPVRPFSAETTPTDYGLLIDVAGELDIATAPDLRRALAARAPEGGLLLVDLTSATFMDSSGLSVVLALHAELRAAGARLAIVCPPGPVYLLFEVTGVEDELPLFPTREAALA